MDEILFLSHRIPYPPNKGDKIRSWRLLERLAKRYAVHLGCFVDDPADLAYREHLERICESAYFAPLHPRLAKLLSLRGLATGEALSLPYFRHGGLQRWARKIRERPLAAEIAYSSPMAQYLKTPVSGRPRIIDLVDVDSEKWRQYAQARRGADAWIYNREATCLARAEDRICAAFDANFFISPEEAAIVSARNPGARERIDWFGNGVDCAYFDPAGRYASPFQSRGGIRIVFTGAMDYWANEDAACWFAEEIFPPIRRTHPDAEFIIVGSRPSARVQALAKSGGVFVTGRVADVRPYLAHSDIAVAPMRIARGVQNKVLEAMAMAKPVVATPDALAGLHMALRQSVLTAQGTEEFIQCLLEIVNKPIRGRDLGARARRDVAASSDWAVQLERFDRRLASLLGKSSVGVAEFAEHRLQTPSIAY